MRHLFPALFTAAAVTVALGAPAGAFAQDADLTITIKDHRFQPETLEVPAGKKVTLTVVNADPSAEEFESRDLKVEKVIGGGKTAKVNIGPLKPGSYSFIGEYHEDTAKGTVVAK